MRKIFPWLLKYGKTLYLVTVVIVLLFQMYWIRESFRINKQRLFRQIEFTMKNELASLNLKKIYSLEDKFSGKERLKLNLDSIIKSAKDLSVQDRTTVQIQNYLTDVQVEVNDTNSLEVLNKLKNTEGYDSVLYSGIKKEIDMLSDASVIIYSQSGNKKSVFPRNSSVGRQDPDPSSGIRIQNGTYQVHIEHLHWVIFKSIWGQLVFSFAYVLLFLITVGALMYTARMQKVLLDSKNSFTRNMTHELKIPVSTLQVAIESLDKYYNNSLHPEVSRYTMYMKHSLRQLSAMIDSILHTAKMEEGKIEPRLSSVNIHHLLKEVVQDISLQVKDRNAQVIVAETKEEIRVDLDPSLMKHVFLNLIDNSLKYSIRRPVIYISVRKNNKQLIITFSDNGQGIPSRYFEEVFQPYFRVENKDTHDVKGYGLGLSHAREVIHLHRGKICIKKSDAEGTDIEISIPLT